MLKKLIVYIVPFSIPFILYGLYWLLARRRASRGQSLSTWLWLLVSGVLLCVLTAGVLALTGGHEPGGQYIPPRVEDGVLKPGEFRAPE
ncbi:MAG: DUF6111 family protein [Minwuia sp.]|uniref:DUF6111 family protein n=1 Tax=Minwuia sp. TaxID=2493630 RepID=UPI003A8C0902